jgi:hypothetical protein
VSSFSSEERAQTITHRLEKIAEDGSVDSNLLVVEEQGDVTQYCSVSVENFLMRKMQNAELVNAELKNSRLSEFHLS